MTFPRPRLLGVRACTTLVCTLALMLALYAEAVAGPPAERLDTFFTKVSYILGGIETEADFHDRLPAIRRQVAEIFDARAAAERVLGREWHARTPAEQEEFVGLFASLLERAFLARIGSNVDVIQGVRSRYLSETIEGDHATVVVAMGTRGGAEMPIEYRMVNRNARWAVSDVVVDGVSLVANYGAQFSRVLALGAYPELVARMRAKVPAPSMVAAAASDRTSDARDNGTPKDARSMTIETSAGTREPRVLMPPLVAPPPAHPVPVVAPPPPVVAPSPPVVAASPPVVAAPPVAVVAAVPAPLPPPREPAPPRAIALRQPPTPDPAPPVRRVSSYWVQVGAFKSAESAVTLVSRLGNEDIAIVTEPASSNGRPGEPLFRVRVGPFAEHARAIAKQRELQRTGIGSFIVSER
ncbi:MAG: ABC transporter substrate-binding protein [Candidatus Rokubacteria bacterium]|nr:ABC transporter substrate-binding protein [Candidatus Rokubacteria bacterium]